MIVRLPYCYKMTSLTLLILVGAVVSATAQDETARVERHLIKINALLPGMEYEAAVSRLVTLNVNPYLRPSYTSRDGLILQPAAHVQVRKYYNLARRQNRDKNITGNSGAFVGLSIFGASQSLTNAEDFRSDNYYGLGPVWGIQRTFGSNFNLSANGGVGYTIDNQQFVLLLNLRIGWALFRSSR